MKYSLFTSSIAFFMLLAVASAAPLNAVVHQANNTAPSVAPTVAQQAASPAPSGDPSESPVPTESAAASESPVPSETSSAGPSPTASKSAAPSPSASVTMSVSVSAKASTSVAVSASVNASAAAPVPGSPGASPSVATSAKPSAANSTAVTPSANSTAVTPSANSTAVTPSVVPTPSVTASPGSSKSAAPSVGASTSADASVSPADATPSVETGFGGLEVTTSPDPVTRQQPPCFPASATVQLKNGQVKRMDQLAVGDHVFVGSGLFSEVFMFTHKLKDVRQEFVSVTTVSGNALRLTPGHYLPVNGAYVPASHAKVGDTVELANGELSQINSLERVSDIGLFNPQTTHGDIVVDGVRASTYTTAVELKMAHALLAPLRFACDQFGLRTTLFEAGADRIGRFTSRFA